MSDHQRMALTFSRFPTSSNPSCNFSQKTFSTLGSGHHLRQVTVLTIIRNVAGSWSGVTLGMKMQIITFSPRSRETCTTNRITGIFMMPVDRDLFSIQLLTNTSLKGHNCLQLFNFSDFLSLSSLCIHLFFKYLFFFDNSN